MRTPAPPAALVPDAPAPPGHRRTTGALTALLALALLAGTAREATAADAPNWTLTSTAGETVVFDDARRQGPSIILFWATWCPYCKALMPHLQSMLEEYRGEQPLRIHAISYREDGRPQAYLARQGFTFTAFTEGGEAVAEAYDVSGTPGLFVVDQTGRIVLNLYRLNARMAADPAWQRLSHEEQASRRAPWWAARIRETLDVLYADTADTR